MSLWDIVKLIATVPMAGATGLFALSKCLFLARGRAGWLMWAANIVYELLGKRLGWCRAGVDAALFVLTSAGWALVAGPWAGLAVAAVLGLLWAWALHTDLRWRRGRLSHQDRRYTTGPIRAPMPLPNLVLIVRGPALSRRGPLELGTWPAGHEGAFEALVLNPSTVRPQFPMRVEVVSDSSSIEVLDAPEGDRPAPEPGQYALLPFHLRAAQVGAGGDVHVCLHHGDGTVTETLRLREVVAGDAARPAAAAIRRWKSGAAAAFCWRGDLDLYDPATFQSAEGLRASLGLSRRFRVPSTLYLSGRLSLEPDEHRAFCEKLGVDRRSDEIPDYIRFLREQVDVRAEIDFPLQTDRPFAVELANHMYLHLDTHAAAAPGNNWTWHARIGAGRYPWQSEAGSFAEQRDNARKNAQVLRDVLGVETRNWGIPGRSRDEHTPAAIEAAGNVVGGDTDADRRTHVLKLTPPHHPAGAERLVEITEKYPTDPDDAYRLAMLKYWLHAARRRGWCFEYFAHHHLRLWDGRACYHLTEEMLRHVLADCHGDFYVSTVSGVALYWERVLCPQHRCVRCRVDGGTVFVQNTGDADLDRLPVEIDLAGGGRFMALVDVPAGQTARVAPR